MTIATDAANITVIVISAIVTTIRVRKSRDETEACLNYSMGMRERKGRIVINLLLTPRVHNFSYKYVSVRFR